jgi:hypothetical protein
VRRLVDRWSARLDNATGEASLSDYYAGYVEAGSTRTHVARHPVRSLAALVAVIRLPTLHPTLSGSAGGRSVRYVLTRPALFGTPLGWTGAAVLDVPVDPQDYLLGASKQTLRRKVRSAERRGITWRGIDDPLERQQLLKQANDAEVAHVDPRYRNHHPDNADLLDHDLWLAAFDRDGVPLLLSVTPTDGAWGQLRYFRIMGSSPAHSDARYFMFPVLVEALAARGVRHLTDAAHPVDLPNGLRHFQRMVGFRLTRVVPRKPSFTREQGTGGLTW